MTETKFTLYCHVVECAVTVEDGKCQLLQGFGRIRYHCVYHKSRECPLTRNNPRGSCENKRCAGFDSQSEVCMNDLHALNWCGIRKNRSRWEKYAIKI